MPFPTLPQILRSVSDLFHQLGDDVSPIEPRHAAPPELSREEVELRCRLPEVESVPELESRLYECSQELRGRADYERARPLLRSLALHSENPVMRAMARRELEVSLGTDITDSNGHVIEEGAGTGSALNPFNWFKNLSD